MSVRHSTPGPLGQSFSRSLELTRWGPRADVGEIDAQFKLINPEAQRALGPVDFVGTATISAVTLDIF